VGERISITMIGKKSAREAIAALIDEVRTHMRPTT